MRYFIILFLLLASCSTVSGITKTEQLATPEEVAKIRIKPNLDLPPPLVLDKYKLQEDNVKQFTQDGKTYIGISEDDMLLQEELLLVLKSRVAELQRIILDAQKLM